MTSRIVLLGTGTHVGKTHVGCVLARALREAGHTVRALKPIESGYVATDSDAAALAGAAGHALVPPLYGLPDPVSPHLAARRAGVTLNLDLLHHWVARQTDTTLHYVIVESAGGALSPLGEDTTNADLTLTLAPARVVLVAPDRLGVLHDLSACLAALQRRAVRVDHVVLSQPPPGDASTGTNAEELERLRIACVDAVIGRDAPDARALLDALRLA